MRQRGPAAQGDDRAAVCGWQVRGDVCGVGCVRCGRRLRGQQEPERCGLGQRPAAGDQCVVGRRQGVCGVAVAQDGQDLPAAERGGVGVCGAGRHDDARIRGATRSDAIEANCHGCGSQWDRQQTGAGRLIPSQRIWPARHARQRVGMGGGLLARLLSGCADGRLGLDDIVHGKWSPCPSRRFLGSTIRGSLRSAIRNRDTTDNRVNYIGFRVGRTLTP